VPAKGQRLARVEGNEVSANEGLADVLQPMLGANVSRRKSPLLEAGFLRGYAKEEAAESGKHGRPEAKSSSARSNEVLSEPEPFAQGSPLQGRFRLGPEVPGTCPKLVQRRLFSSEKLAGWYILYTARVHISLAGKAMLAAEYRDV